MTKEIDIKRMSNNNEIIVIVIIIIIIMIIKIIIIIIIIKQTDQACCISRIRHGSDPVMLTVLFSLGLNLIAFFP